MISVEKLKVEFGVTPLFSDVSFVINKKDRIALVGKNGAGKSTLLKILAGMQLPTAGNVSVPRDVSVGYLPQVMNLSDSGTVMEEAESAFEHIADLKNEIDRLNNLLAERTDYESDEYKQLIERFVRESERYDMMGGANYKSEIEKTLLGLGFMRSDFDRPTSEFSGGWRMRMFVASLGVGVIGCALLGFINMHGVVGELTVAVSNGMTSALVILCISLGVAIPNIFLRKYIAKEKSLRLARILDERRARGHFRL